MTELYRGVEMEPDITFEREPDGSTGVRLELGEADVSRAYIVPRAMRIGRAVLMVDGIAGVETEEEYQGRGYGRRVMEAAVRRMRAGDASISVLWGIPDYYEKFGYTTAGPQYSLMLALEDAARGPDLPPGWTVRRFVPEDLPAVRRLYEGETSRAVGPMLRAPEGTAAGRVSPAWSVLLERADQGICRVIVAPSGDIEGYAWSAEGFWWVPYLSRAVPESFLLAEAIASGPTAADAVLSACAALAAEGGHQHVEIAAAPEGPVAMAAMLRGGAFTMHYSRSGALMCRCLDVRRLLVQLLPELTARLNEAGVDWEGTLRIETDEDQAMLLVGAGELSVVEGVSEGMGDSVHVRIPQHDLARLALGAFPPRDLLARLPEPPSEQGAELLAALFPARHLNPYLADSY